MSRSFVRKLADSLRSSPSGVRTLDDPAYLDLADVLLFVLATDGTVRHVNQRGCEALGRFASEVVGRPWAELVALGDERDGRQTSSVLRSDGTVRAVEWRFSARHDEQGEVLELVASGVDVTEQEAARTQLVELRKLARDVATLDDARQAIMDHAIALTGAQSVALLEAGVVTAAAGQPAGLDLDAVAETIRTGTGRTAGFTRYEPVAVQHVAVGALALVWPAGPTARDLELATLLAEETAVALRRLESLRSLELAALTDPLTGVANRRAVDLELPRAMARAKRRREPLALAMLDLNDFKALNDGHGHDAGDRLLKTTASNWADELRGTDLIARLGGDEFAVILADCAPEYLAVVERRLREAVPYEGGTSIGIAEWDGRQTPEQLVQAADSALYADKAQVHAGRVSDPDRLGAVQATGLLEQPRDPELDELTRAASYLLGVPVVLVSLVDADRQVFAGLCGLEGWAADARQTPLTHSFCQHAIAAGRPLVINDAREEPLVAENLAIPDLGVVAYAGIPLAHAEGPALGVLCAIDTQPRAWTLEELTMLERLAARAEATLRERTVMVP